MKTALREFGARDQSVYYKPRPGAYAVVRDAEGRFAIVGERGRCFLPGGGIDAGESAEQALLREIREECGCHAKIVGSLGEAIQYSWNESEGHLAVHATYFAAEFAETMGEPCEAGCKLLWMTAEEAADHLFRESDVWMLRRIAAEK